MASKAAKKGANPLASSTPASQSGKSTPISTPSGHHRSASPLSPTRTSRLQEKAELQTLNDRLATYIDRVRHLETENNRLTVQIQTSEETITREVTNIKQMYDHELSDARKLLDETAREKARLEIDLKRLLEENADLRARLDKKSKDFIVADNNARMYESRFTDISGKYNTAVSERKKYQDEAKELDKECDKLRKQLDALRKNLEEETLTRVDLENTLQSLREELSFKDGIHQQELQETRTRRQVELSEIDGRLTEKYEEKLRESLQELRDQYENQMRVNRDEIDMLYDAKIKNLQNALNSNSNQAASAYEELRLTKTTIDGLKSRINELEGNNASLQSRIRDLENLLELERNRQGDHVRNLEAELLRLREEMALQLQEYQDLMDIKVSLDMEIGAYDKMLAGEEHRLNISAAQSASSTSFRSASRTGRRTPSRTSVGIGAKRKRTLLEESEERNFSDFSITASAKGDIEIVDCDPEGRFVKVHNKGNKEVQIGGWQLVRTAGSNETTFKFHRSVKADGGATVTVWSTDIPNVNHEPPASIVMNGKKWFVGDNMKTVLLNGDGEEVAASERVRQQLSSLAQRHRELGGGGEDYYHHSQLRSASRASSYGSGDARGTEKCRVM